MTFVDSHCHIDGMQYDDDRDEVVQRALDAGVALMLNIGTGDPQSEASSASDIALRAVERATHVGAEDRP